MNTWIKNSGVAASFLVGCLAGTTSIDHWRIQKAQASPSSAKWTYTCIDEKLGRGAASEIAKQANVLGQKGWEMVAMSAGRHICFKRRR